MRKNHTPTKPTIVVLRRPWVHLADSLLPLGKRNTLSERREREVK
jgi:hypothetical protein